MPAKVNIGALLRKNLGKQAGDAMASKIEKMISQKNSAAEIEKALRAGLTAHLATQKHWTYSICSMLSQPVSTVSHAQKEWINAICSKASRPVSTVGH